MTTCGHMTLRGRFCGDLRSVAVRGNPGAINQILRQSLRRPWPEDVIPMEPPARMSLPGSGHACRKPASFGCLVIWIIPASTSS